jgi:hypothetical protein
MQPSNKLKAANTSVRVLGGGATVGTGVRPPRAAESKGRQSSGEINKLNFKKTYFLGSLSFKLPRQKRRLNKRDFFKC